MRKQKEQTFTEQIGVRLYCIRNAEGEYWYNDFGWITLENDQDESPFNVFTEGEKEIYNLPLGGHWEIL